MAKTRMGQEGRATQPDALDLLESQHRQVEALFGRLAELEPGDPDLDQLLAEVADALAVHASIEEQIFYPAVEDRQTERFLEQAVQDHLQVKRVLVTILEGSESRNVSAEIEELAGLTEGHVIEEETDLFPKVRKLFTSAELRQLGEQMMQLEAQLRSEGDPRSHTRDELEAPAPL